MENLLDAITVPGWLYMSVLVGLIVAVGIIIIQFTLGTSNKEADKLNARINQLESQVKSYKDINDELRGEIGRKEGLIVNLLKKKEAAKTRVRKKPEPKA